MIIATPTITHTGTRCLHRRVLKSPEVYRVCSPGHQKPGTHGIVFHTHMFSSLRNIWESYAEADLPIIIPLVHPARNFVSCVGYKRPEGQFEEQWDNLIAFVETCNPMFLHVDDKELREVQAEKIQKAFQIPLGVDWTADKTSGAVHGTNELGETELPINCVPENYIEFYNRTKRV